MKKIVFLLLITVSIFSCKQAKENKTVQNAKEIGESITISTDEIKDIVAYLASDELKGRDTGTEGIDKAAFYIQKHFEQNGVKPYFETYRDDFKFNSKTDSISGFNVVGYIEGTDENLKNEVVLIGAHYDHIGFQQLVENDSIANGANDNASGTASVMSIAKYFSARKNNKRSIIFALFSAEEKGLKGSAHIAKRLKEKDIDLYTMINFEMLGVPFVGRDYDVFITGYDKSNFAEKFNGYQGSKLIGESEVSKKYNLYMRSDNYAFVKEFNVPSHTISSCDLTNFDHYHKVSDEVKALDFNFMSSFVNKVIPGLEKLINAPTKEIVLNEE